jgi:hypothetical protein
MVRTLKGLYDATVYRTWKISVPFANKKYIFAGSERDARESAEKLFPKWIHALIVEEVDL